MRYRTFLWSLLLGLLFVTYACSDETPGMSVDLPSGGSVSLGAEQGADQTLPFHAGQDWTSSVNADWLEVEPSSGGAGDHALKLRVIKPNDTGKARTATLTLISGEDPLRVTVTQDEYIRLDKGIHQMPVEGGPLHINFYTTLEKEKVGVYALTVDWVTSQEGQATRVDESGYHISLYVQPNEGDQARTALFYFVKEPHDGDHVERNILATATVLQAGRMSGTSGNYEDDGKVTVLQEHTAGNGIPLVLMGDGFIDTEIKSGYYGQVMDKAVENIFTEHPISELKEYFDIYSVTVVSPANTFGSGQTALGCWMDAGTSTGVGGDDEAVQTYAQKVEGIELDNTQVVVILNSDAYKGTNYNYWYSDGRPSDFSIAYFPIIADRQGDNPNRQGDASDNLESEDFRRVLVHETVGHGIGKLDDEYAYEENPVMPTDEMEQRRQQQQDFGWWQNVDFTDNAEEVLWSDFLFDTRYDGQGLGIFEGACTYMTGAYRSTEESMMRNNIQGFNAPSRRAIYNNIIQRGEGRTPSLEEFIDFDQRTYAAPAQTRSLVPSRPFGRPQVRRLDRPLGQ